MGMRPQNKIFAVLFSLNNCLVTFPHFDNPNAGLRVPPWADATTATEKNTKRLQEMHVYSTNASPKI